MFQGPDPPSAPLPAPLLRLPNTFRPFYGAFAGLRPVQIEAMAPILEGRDLIVQAATGSGKSEAVLAPALERVITSGRAHGVLYIIPTRALAKDLMRRFEPIITERLNLILAIRTGDIKKGGNKRPDIMFTTPESLDVLLGTAKPNLKAFLARVGTVIIDEVHPLVHQYRGRHLVYLFTRLERRTNAPIQKIAMSATISGIPGVMDFFNFRPDSTAISDDADRQIQARLLHLKKEDIELPALLNDLYREWGYRKILVFCNSRSACDRLSGIVRRNGVFREVTELHYSNLKAKERKKAEDRFRKNPHALCIATSTLELGIDVGDVDAVLLYQPPGSVSAFLQRIGRANRRGQSINFWGICSGEAAGNQVIRFLALLALGRQGKIEAPTPKALPSVLSQQVISCLYEKKEISLNALKALFADRKSLLPDIFKALEKKGWLRRADQRTGRPGLFRGGWQYRNHFMAYKIWGNFPESEKEYILEVDMESIADIPQSIVDQMEVGDRVYLSGRRLKILKIEEGEPGKVTARPAMKKDDKDLVWVGLGAHVSWETAQAMGRILDTGTLPRDSGLMARTQKLFHLELSSSENRVVLANGIEVVPGTRAKFHFRTFLGSAGNLVLEWAVRDHFQDDDIEVASSETGVECACWIDFQKLNLPVTKKAFHTWVLAHFRVLRSLIPLSIFWRTLPQKQMVEEVADFLFDQRVADTFARYLELGSDIVSGDIANLSGPLPMVADESLDFEMQACAALLSHEKQAAKPPEDLPFLSPVWQAPCLDPDRSDARALTATMVSDYMFHGQCDRRFCLSYLGLAHPVKEQDHVMALVREQGVQHEQAVLAALEHQGNHLAVPEPAAAEEPRWAPSVKLLGETIAQLAGRDPEKDPPVWLSQCYLKTEEPIRQFPHITGIGIPDLLKLSPGKGGQTIIQAGDIKRSQKPGYHHKWQVAFYALALEQIIDRCNLPARVSSNGFIITPPPLGDVRETAPYQIHEFDLTPYMATLPTLLNHLGHVISSLPAHADYRLQNLCTACSGFPGCYHHALAHEDIRFLPQLTQGELAALKQMGCTTLEQLPGALENQAALLSPGQQKKLTGWGDAFLTGRIRCHKKKTHQFPANLSRPMFIHLEKDPLEGLPRVLGWQVLDTDGRTIVESKIWTMETHEERQAVRQTFLRELARVWEQSIHAGQGPHLFHFGAQTPAALNQWVQWPGEAQEPSWEFLGQTQPSPWTDIQKVLTAHFYMPAPGTASLYTLGRIFNCQTLPAPPPTLFHHNSGFISDIVQAAAQAKQCLGLMAELYQTAVSRLESQWIREWPPVSSSQVNPGDKKARPYTTFIQEEQRLKEADIMMLQEQPLEERMLRFRSLGYLKFVRTRLDSFGRFINLFRPTDQTWPAKFRQGDFLKLVPHGMADLQNGFPVIMVEYDRQAGDIGLLSRSGKINLNKELFYSLEEDMDDWNREKLLHAAQTLFSEDRYFHLRQLLAGTALEKQGPASGAWVEKWLARDNHGLNPSQQQALRLPFQYCTAMIQGPPGTGKTHVLGWIIIALILEAHETGKPLRIGISALTHQAIDTVLKKVVQLVNQYLPDDFPGLCVKWGEENTPESGTSSPGHAAMKVEYTKEARDLPTRPWLILGATGYGFYSLFNSRDKGFPLALDWMIFDEASQVPVPQALLSLIYGRENFLFLGDVHQLPPIVMGNYDPHDNSNNENQLRLNNSILSNIRDLYPEACQVTLDTTFRMNREICAFPSKTWYYRRLCPHPSVENARLCLNEPDDPGEKYNPAEDDPILRDILDPKQPVTLVLTDHQGCAQQSDVEADLMAALARRLILGHGLSPDRMAIITPHRAQNNAILQRLGKILADQHPPDPDNTLLPLVDTVERIQGAERDIILFGLTASDPDHLTSEFLNSPNRLNVAMTRARKKLVIMGSQAFFSLIPDSEALLAGHCCFKQLLTHCRTQNAVFYFPKQLSPF
ncbi:DEAD/DEAH box helicase [Desulfobacter vibrioformis]|uniref:DEAD/DEAH box helicase n=1 Tax=Desulfobacter vibrioformis TaxID=34031 RepID=UPI0005531303|nr:DEAD/DEAH box helicase [Desulfobacter vibrioformis]